MWQPANVDAHRGDVTAHDGIGYMAASMGTLTGGLVGVAIGQLLGVPLAVWAVGGVQTSGDAEGVEAAIEGVGAGLAAVVLAVLAFAVAVLATAWLGAVLGCALAVQVSGHGLAGRTALLTGCAGPPIVVALLWLATALGVSMGDGRADLVLATAAVLAALAGRWLALRGPARPGTPGVDVAGQ